MLSCTIHTQFTHSRHLMICDSTDFKISAFGFHISKTLGFTPASILGITWRFPRSSEVSMK